MFYVVFELLNGRFKHHIAIQPSYSADIFYAQDINLLSIELLNTFLHQIIQTINILHERNLTFKNERQFLWKFFSQVKQKK